MTSVAVSVTGGGPGSVAAIADDVRRGRRSAVSVLADHRARIEANETGVHAFNVITADLADATAHAVDEAIAAGRDPGPLAGVPVALKDNMCTRAIATTCSSRILEGWRPPYDATVTQRLAAGGAVLMGKTNLDEFAMGSSTENSAFGPTRNPHDLGRVPGGSSGGSAAAVAAGFAAASLGSDTGGSIRQPASFCGLVGMKPTYGAVSRYGLIAFASSLDQIGPFTHTVEDAALVLSVIAGHDPRDSTSIADLDTAGYVAAARAGAAEGVAGVRVGIVDELSGEGIDADVLERMEVAADLLRAAGAVLTRVQVPAARYGLAAYYLIAPAECSSNLARYDGIRYGLRVTEGTENAAQMMAASRAAGFGAEVKRRIMLGTYALSSGYYDAYYAQAQKLRTLIIRDFASAYQGADVLLTPTAPTTAFPLGDRTEDPMKMYINDVCTIPSNLSGDPAISVPCGSGADGLPVGVQLLGPALSETLLLRTAAAIESALAASTGAPR